MERREKNRKRFHGGYAICIVLVWAERPKRPMRKVWRGPLCPSHYQYFLYLDIQAALNHLQETNYNSFSLVIKIESYSWYLIVPMMNRKFCPFVNDTQNNPNNLYVYSDPKKSCTQIIRKNCTNYKTSLSFFC